MHYEGAIAVKFETALIKHIHYGINEWVGYQVALCFICCHLITHQDYYFDGDAFFISGRLGVEDMIDGASSGIY